MYAGQWGNSFAENSTSPPFLPALCEHFASVTSLPPDTFRSLGIKIASIKDGWPLGSGGRYKAEAPERYKENGRKRSPRLPIHIPLALLIGPPYRKVVQNIPQYRGLAA
ncbi:hypothetical protein P8C59_004714 [Phyllachora maydis]|uniref:Uncharacterized protein n=1 Tax=Phyllachora maydis TaxID=1825666 RepID=A0AAD9MCR8_9PEZI|nr:hypothetical protein P8C59_004714 [Phyllachora maydis]